MMLTVGLVIELAWKSLLVAGVALVLLRLTVNRSPAERSWIAHIGLVALALLAPIAVLAPAWNPLPTPVAVPFAETTVEAPTAAELPVTVAASPNVLPSAPVESWTLPTAVDLALWLYLVPMALLVLTMLIAVVRLQAMHRRANVLVDAPWIAALAQAQKRMGFKHGTALLVSDELRSPVSWGVMRPIIVLNPDAVQASREAEAIIAHELAHVARLDWAKLLIARLACALFWFNPLVWLLAREAHQLREEAADDAVLLSDVPDTEYASLLVNAARHDNKALLMAAHGVAPAKNSLHRRILRVLDGGLARRPAGTAWTALCLVALFGVAAPLAALDPTARTATADEEGTFVAKPQGLGSIVAGVVSNVVPAAIRDTLGGSPDLARDIDTNPDVDVDVDTDAPRTEAERLIEMKAVGLTPDYIAAMREAGFTDADTDGYIEARAVGVTPEFAREMRRFDPAIALDDVVEARAVGFTPSYFGTMKRAFYRLTFDDAVELAALNITPEFVSEMRALFPDLTAEQAVDMKAVGVTPAFVREMRREGIATRTPDDAVEGRLFTTSVAKPSKARTVEVRNESRTVSVSEPPEPPAPPPAPRAN